MIIFGLRGRLTTTGTGTFFCPRCTADRDYSRKAVRRWFTLFFVPVVPVSGLTSPRVVCATCGGAFTESVLNVPTTDAFRALYLQSLRRCAAAILKAGDAQSVVARTCAILAVHEASGGTEPFDDDALDAELAEVDPAQLAVYVSPVANRLDSRSSEQFFGACAQVALADGELSTPEADALGNLGESLNLTQAHQLGVLETLRAPVEPRSDRSGGST